MTSRITRDSDVDYLSDDSDSIDIQIRESQKELELIKEQNAFLSQMLSRQPTAMPAHQTKHTPFKRKHRRHTTTTNIYPSAPATSILPSHLPLKSDVNPNSESSDSEISDICDDILNDLKSINKHQNNQLQIINPSSNPLKPYYPQHERPTSQNLSSYQRAEKKKWEKEQKRTRDSLKRIDLEQRRLALEIHQQQKEAAEQRKLDQFRQDMETKLRLFQTLQQPKHDNPLVMHLLMQQMRNEQNQTSQALQQEIRETQKMINSLSKEEHVQIPLVAPSITPSHPVHTLHTPQPAQMRVTTSFTPAAHGAAVSSFERIAPSLPLSEEQAQALQDEHERNLDRMRQLREEKEESRLRMLRMKRIREEREEILSYHTNEWNAKNEAQRTRQNTMILSPPSTSHREQFPSTLQPQSSTFHDTAPASHILPTTHTDQDSSHPPSSTQQYSTTTSIPSSSPSSDRPSWIRTAPHSSYVSPVRQQQSRASTTLAPILSVSRESEWEGENERTQNSQTPNQPRRPLSSEQKQLLRRIKQTATPK